MTQTYDLTTPEGRLDAAVKAGITQIDRTQLAVILGIRRESVDAARRRSNRGSSRMIEPDGYVGRVPWWKPRTVRKLIVQREQSWSRHPKDA